MSIADEIIEIFQARGSGAYFGENVSMTEHALQAAYFAQIDAAPTTLIVAALLHDIGHLIENVPSDIADWTTDARHELSGSRWLARHFSPEVSEPVRLHVPAKRYLLATDAEYFSKLSPASIITLKLQGGPMTAQEITQFEDERFYQAAVRVRQWDDRGKIAGLKTPIIKDYYALLEAVAK